MTDNEKIISKLESLHSKILKSDFAKTVYETEVMALILAVKTITSQSKEIERLKEACRNSNNKMVGEDNVE